MSEDATNEQEPEPVTPEKVIDGEDAQDGDGGLEPQPEPQSAPEQAPRSEREIEKALKAVERAGTSYRNSISKAMGEDAQALVPCPRCNAPVAGMIFPPDAAPVDDETRDAVLASLGLGADAGPPLQDAKGVETCPVCLGHGQLKYPTLNPHMGTQQCPRCIGNGYISVEDQQQPVIQFPHVTTTTGSTATFTPGPCPLCNAPGMAGQPHYCNPASATG